MNKTYTHQYTHTDALQEKNLWQAQCLKELNHLRPLVNKNEGHGGIEWPILSSELPDTTKSPIIVLEPLDPFLKMIVPLKAFEDPSLKRAAQTYPLFEKEGDLGSWVTFQPFSSSLSFLSQTQTLKDHFLRLTEELSQEKPPSCLEVPLSPHVVLGPAFLRAIRFTLQAKNLLSSVVIRGLITPPQSPSELSYPILYYNACLWTAMMGGVHEVLLPPWTEESIPLIVDCVKAKILMEQESLLLTDPETKQLSSDPLKGTSSVEHATALFLSLGPSPAPSIANPTLSSLRGYPGRPPYTRGPYASMYVSKPWTIRQYAGLSTAEESNAFYRKALKGGQRGLSVAFDLATHRGFDSDDPRVKGDVGMAGVAIDSILDMRQLFDGIPLKEMSVSMTMNGAVLPILALFILAGKEQGVPSTELSGTIQNDILKEFMVRNTYIYPPEPSMRIIGDIFAYTGKHMPKFNSISISGYHLQEAGASPELELAYTLANGLEYLKLGISRGLSIDDFAPRLSFFFAIGMNFWEEVAKLRAARHCWYHFVKRFHPKKEKSCILRTHCQTSGWSLTSQDVRNNITRTHLEAMSAIFGQTQSLHTNSYDEAICLPTEESARVARETQLFIEKYQGVCDGIDLLHGHQWVEKRTEELIESVFLKEKEIESWGGMTKAIIQGIPKKKIEESATRTQAKIDGGEQIIMGVNSFKRSPQLPPEQIEVRSIDNHFVRQQQIEKLKTLRSNRSTADLEQRLKELKEIAQESRSGNLLEGTLEAMSCGATVGEVSAVLEEVFGRYEARPFLVTGVYRREKTMPSPLMDEYEKELVVFRKNEGRNPRILLAKVGQDGHDRGQKVVASGLADLGMDVDIGPLFQTPEQVVKAAIENDVHFLGVSSLAAGHLTLVPEILRILQQQKREDILVVLGGVIPPADQKILIEQGVVSIFGPGTPIEEVALGLVKAWAKNIS